MTPLRGLVTPLITTHEPPSRGQGINLCSDFRIWGFRVQVQVRQQY